MPLPLQHTQIFATISVSRLSVASISTIWYAHRVLAENEVPAVMEAVKVYTSVGEVAWALKDVYGTYQGPIRF